MRVPPHARPALICAAGSAALVILMAGSTLAVGTHPGCDTGGCAAPPAVARGGPVAPPAPSSTPATTPPALPPR